MNVLDHGPQRFWVCNVAIIAATPLPETVMHFAIGLHVTKSVEKRRSLPPQKGQSLPLYRHLQGSADQPDLVCSLSRADDHMDVFGHDDVGPQV